MDIVSAASARQLLWNLADAAKKSAVLRVAVSAADHVRAILLNCRAMASGRPLAPQLAEANAVLALRFVRGYD